MIVATFDAGLCNMGLCIMDTVTNHVIALENIKLFERAVPAPSFHTMAQRINQVLEELFPLLCKCDTVVMEKQVRVNQKASRVTVHIMSWFSIVFPHIKISEMHARHKTEKLGLTTVRGRKYHAYKLRKQACVDEALVFLTETDNTEALAMFLNEPKKDDISDALCMGICFKKS